MHLHLRHQHHQRRVFHCSLLMVLVLEGRVLAMHQVFVPSAAAAAAPFVAALGAVEEARRSHFHTHGLPHLQDQDRA
jgi:hypothetical protein